MKTALLLSHRRDYFTIDRVAEALEKEKIKTIRLDTDCFPETIKISERVDQSDSSILVQTESRTFDTHDIDVVWYRKIWKPIIKSPMEEQYLNASIKESIAVRKALFQSMQHLPWLDPIPLVEKASDKFHQLRIAQSVGLSIPQTIISNDPRAVKSFYKKLKGGMICKLHTPLSASMEGNSFSLYTTQVQEEDLDELDMLEVCPMIFQELIPKAYELRIAYIDQACYTGKIISKNTIDWRKPNQDVSWDTYTISESLREQLIALMQKLDLSFGAIDLIAKPDGSYVFLEVNPVGEWGMLEMELNLPISQAIAKGLLNRIS